MTLFQEYKTGRWLRERIFLVLIALPLFSSNSYPQEYWRFDQLSFKDGLGGDWYFHIAEDSLGFIWMASHTGLTRYDGRTAKHYSNEPNDSLSLGENQVFRLFVNGPNEIWCSTLGGGLSILNPQTGEFDNLNPKTSNWPVPRMGQVIKKSENLLYFIRGGHENSIIEVTIVNDSMNFREFPIEGITENLHFRDNKVRYFFEDPKDDNLLWIIGNFRIYSFDIANESLDVFYEFDFLLDKGIQFDLIPAAEWMDEDHLMLSIQHFGVFKLSLRTGNYEKLFLHEHLLPHHPRFIRKLHDGAFLISYSNGKLLHYDHATNTKKKIKIQYPFDSTPYSEFIFEAQNGDIYLATNGAGVYRLNKHFHKISVIDRADKTKPNYGNYFSRSFHLPDTNFILFSSFRVDSLFLVNTINQYINIVSGSVIEGIFWGNFIGKGNGNILTHNGKSIFRFSGKDFSLKNYPLEGIDTLFNDERHIKFIEFDENGKLWVLGNSFIRIYNGQKLEAEHQLIFENGEKFDNYHNYVRLENQVIFTRLDNHFFSFDLDRKYIVELKDNIADQPYSDFYLRTPIKIDSTIYIGCHLNGVWKTRITTDSIIFQSVLRAPEYLISNNVYALSKQNDFLWIKTGLGMQRFDPRTKKSIKIDFRHALPQLYMDRKLDIRENGDFSLPLARYLYHGNLHKIIPQKVRAEAFLTGVNVDNRAITKGWISLDELPIHLNHKNKILELSWSILNASPDYSYQLYYKMEGFDADWRELNPQEDFNATYTNLSEGKYNFILKCHPLVNQQPFELLNIPIIIKPPYWRTWWFRILLSAAIFGIVFSLYKWRINTIKKEERLKREFNEKIAQLELSQLRSQMNPHFMFNCLNSIKLYILKNEKELAAEYLSSFSQLVRDILNYSSLDFIPLWDEIRTLKTYIELEKMRFSKEFDFELDIDPQIDLTHTSVPPMLLQPFIENAIWHGLMHKDGERKLNVEFFIVKEKLKVEITDNGIGREKAAQIRSKSAAKKSHGISITQSRLSQFKGIYDLEIIDLKTEHGFPAGTKVIIEIPHKTMD